MKIDFKKPIVAMDGKAIELNDSFMMLNEELAGGIARINETNEPLKLWEWAQNLQSTGCIEVDTQDLELLKTTIKSNRQFTVLLKGQALQEIAKQAK